MITIELRVVSIRREATEMVTIAFERKDGRPLEYRAGQFLTFLFSFRGRGLRRSYSFSSTPGVDEYPSITVKRVANGEVSRYLLGHLAVGDVLMSLPPAGKFVLEEVGGGSLVFLAAGSGMVPVFGLIKEAFESGRMRSRGAGRIVLITQNRDVESVPFRGVLEGMVREYAGVFEWTSLLSSSAPVGRLNNGLLREMLDWIRVEDEEGRPTPMHRFYLCGPPGFMRMAIFTLRLMGVADAQIKRENFTVEYIPPPPLLMDPSPKRVVVHAEGKEYAFFTAWPRTILQSALDQHIALPYSCKGGVCSTCVARCIGGKVKMSINEVLTDKDLRAGLVLTCVGYAETDVELSF